MKQKEQKSRIKTVLILTDMEGISGITDARQVLDFSQRSYAGSLRRLMADTNAAIAGAFDAGAETVYVWDGHLGGGNFIPELLDRRAEEVFTDTIMPLMPSIDAALLIGTHAMAGTPNAFMDHTQSFEGIHHYAYNDEYIGEMTQFAAFVGYFGIPLVMVSGDVAACVEADRLFPGIRTAIVKRAEERMHTCAAISHEGAASLIRRAAAKGLRDADQREPYRLPLPFTITVEFNTTDGCDAACRAPGVERLDAYRARSVTTAVNGYSDFLL